jgi:tellurium resistance protein TerD
MATMKRGSNVSLTREIPGLKRLVLGVAWDGGSARGIDDDLVFAALLCNADDKIISDEHFVFFNQLTSPDLSVQQLASALGSDREQIEIDLPDVPQEVERIAVALYLNGGSGTRRTLGQLRSIEVRALNGEGGVELVRSENLVGTLSSETALVLAEVYRHAGEWKFKVIGDGYSAGIAGLASDYGVAL